jgi:OMF family outer membrane factor
VAGAQPTPAPPPAPPPAPAPAPDQNGQPPPADQNGETPPPADQPTWLLGAKDLTKEELADPGKLKLSMARAVELAERQHPTIRSARAAYEAARGRVDQAAVLLHPVVTLGVSGTVGSQPREPCAALNNDPTATGTCGGFFSAGEGLDLSAGATWRITDFGLTKLNVKAADLNAVAAGASVDSTKLDLRLNVQLAYLQAVAAVRLIIVADATVKSELGHLDQAKRFVAAQAHDPIEVAQAESRVANAKSALAQTQSNNATALATLRAAIGWLDPKRAPVVDPAWPVPSDQEPPALPQLVDNARKRRPDLLQFDKVIEANDASLDAAHAERRPILSASANTQWVPGTGAWEPQPSWVAGLSLTWQAWDGGKSAADARVAAANVQSAIAQRDALLVTLTSTLEAARAQISTNKEAVKAANEGVVAAQAQLNLAEKRYALGLGSQIELADAQTAVTTAAGNLVSAEWQLANAWATLARAAGEI